MPKPRNLVEHLRTLVACGSRVAMAIVVGPVSNEAAVTTATQRRCGAAEQCTRDYK
jgi:hypothetical protein